MTVHLCNKSTTSSRTFALGLAEVRHHELDELVAVDDADIDPELFLERLAWNASLICSAGVTMTPASTLWYSRACSTCESAVVSSSVP
ncbi:hypothetical protein [Sorangium sp. So ce513]|uniref:hypothetical protein n=1 Tax=Sorangium sp. So ce513 TaxID=3133315 RepID=UPI003F5F9A38